MESLISKKKTGLVILGLGAAAAAIWYLSSQSEAEAAALPDGKDYFPSGPTPDYPMPSDQTSSYDPYAQSNNYTSSDYTPSAPSYTPSTSHTTDYPNAYTPALPAYSPTPSATRGDATIQHYQQALSQLGYDPGPIDGVWGSFTRRAVMDFQRDNNLAVDGILGPRTKAAIDGGTGTPAPTSGITGRRTRFWRAAGAMSNGLSRRPSPTSGVGGERCMRWRA